jgi:positive regulator of sigma E activity
MIEKTLSEALLGLIALMKEVAPTLWNIMLKQVYVTAIQQTIGAVLSTLGLFLFIKLYKRGTKEDEDVQQILGVFGILISAMVLVILLVTVPGYYINPEYYAILNIIEMVK